MSYEAALVTQLLSGQINGQEGAKRILDARQKAREARWHGMSRLLKVTFLILAGLILGPFASSNRQS